MTEDDLRAWEAFVGRDLFSRVPRCAHPWTRAVGDRIGLFPDVGAAFLPLVGTGSDLFMHRRNRPCRRGLAFCHHDDPDCRRSLAIALRCALDGTPAQVAR